MKRALVLLPDLFFPKEDLIGQRPFKAAYAADNADQRAEKRRRAAFPAVAVMPRESSSTPRLLNSPTTIISASSTAITA